DLETDGTEWFAGLWIEDIPEFSVVILAAGDPMGLAETILRHGMEGLVRVRETRPCLAEPRQAHNAIRQHLEGTYDSQIDEKENRVELFVLDDDGVRSSVEALRRPRRGHGCRPAFEADCRHLRRASQHTLHPWLLGEEEWRLDPRCSQRRSL